jgi:acetyl esterase
MVAEDHSPDGPVPWRTTLIPADGHAVPVRVFTPPQPSGWLVWAHGGSWRWGSVEQWHAPCADLAVRSRCVVVSVDYRLAPQHRHPAPVDDVLTAMRWAQQQMAHQGTPPAMLAVGGDSAGGTLAATAALAWRDRGRPLAAQLLAYPPLDPACRAASYATVGQFPVRSVLRAAWAAHLGSAADRSRAVRYRSPLHTENLAALAPAILAVGDLDPVRDDVWAYAQRLQETGVPVRFRAFTDTPHGAFLDPDPQIAPTAAGQQEPSLRAWLASSLRHQLDHPAAADHTIP